MLRETWMPDSFHSWDICEELAKQRFYTILPSFRSSLALVFLLWRPQLLLFEPFLRRILDTTAWEQPTWVAMSTCHIPDAESAAMAARFSGVTSDRFSIVGECCVMITPSKRATFMCFRDKTSFTNSTNLTQCALL